MSTGCGNGLANVRGVVTVDDEPLQGGDGVHATVYFQPVTSGTAAAVGKVGENGVYELSTGSKAGILPGEYIATCSATQIIASETPGGTPTGKRITDPKYASAKTSGFRFTVVEGSNEFNLPLESPPAKTPGGRRR